MSRQPSKALPEKPWLARKEWAEGRIVFSGKTSMFVLWLFALLWNLVTVPCCIAVYPKASAAFFNGNWLPLVALVFPAAGLFVVVCAIVSTMRWRKYGSSVFQMASVPGVIGGQLAGVIRTAVKIRPEDSFELKLSCIKVTYETTGKGSEFMRMVDWQDEQVVVHELLHDDAGQSAIPVLFQIPYECSQSGEPDAKHLIIWQLDVAAKAPGLDYRATFDVPVFKTPQSDPSFVVDRGLIAEYTAPENPERELSAGGVVKTASPTGDGCRFVFPMARNPGADAQVTLPGIAFFSVPFWLPYLEPSWLVCVFFGGLFGLIGFGLLLFAVNCWFYRSVIDASPRGLTITGGLFGRGPSRWIAAADILKIKPVSHFRTGDGPCEVLYYDLVVTCAQGTQVTACKRLRGKPLASAVIHQIQQAMGNGPK